MPSKAHPSKTPSGLDEAATVVAEDVRSDLSCVASEISKFTSFSRGRIRETAYLLVRYGIEPIESFRTTDETSRLYLLGDLRKAEQLSFLDHPFLLKLDRHIPPIDRKASGKYLRFDEMDIPRTLASYKPSLSSLISFLLPIHEMANWVRKAIAIATSKDSPFQPCLVPNLSENPWVPLDSDHVAARTKWLGYSTQAKRAADPQELSKQAFTPYRLRFVVVADVCQAWSRFGGLGPRLSHSVTVLHIGITETVGAPLTYHRLVGGEASSKR